MTYPDSINLAEFFHPHGFHREKGKFPGLELANKLRPIIKKAAQNSSQIRINLEDMKAMYGSFVDGAFGEFIDDYKDNFYSIVTFVGGNPDFLTVINRVFNKHKEKNFNEGAPRS